MSWGEKKKIETILRDYYPILGDDVLFSDNYSKYRLLAGISQSEIASQTIIAK